METIVRTENLSKCYNKEYSVDRLNIHIQAGEIYGFLGPNGAGKSTTMKMLLGLVHPTSGKGFLFGREFNEKNRREILIQTGAMIESPACYEHLTGRENIHILQTLLDIPKASADEAIRLVGMSKQMDKKVRNYSLGMKQRLGIAMAIARFPKLLILDEPTNGLDPAGIEEIRELIRVLPEKYGMTLMISSHLLTEIEQVATSIGIICKGQLIFEDRMSEFRSHRAKQILFRTSDDVAAAELLGIENIIYDREGILTPLLPDAKIARLLRKMTENEIDIYRIEERGQSLEDFFLTLTGKEAVL